jgi:hypothetical protein
VLELVLQQDERIGSHVGVKQCAVPVVSFAAVEALSRELNLVVRELEVPVRLRPPWPRARSGMLRLGGRGVCGGM